MNNPSNNVKIVICASGTFLAGKRVDFEKSKLLFADKAFLQNLMYYDKDNISLKLALDVEEQLSETSEIQVKNSSSCAQGLFVYCDALV